MGFSRLVLESDSSIACKLLLSRKMKTNSDFYLLEQCWKIINKTSWDIQINHVRRDANTAADGLA